MNSKTSAISVFIKLMLIFIALFGLILNAFSQVKIGDNPTTISPSSLLELESTEKGLLLPRMTNDQRNQISNPPSGLVIFNTSTDCIEVYIAADSSWKSLCGNMGSGTASFEPDCSTLSVNGTYLTGVALDPAVNTITLNVNVNATGAYMIVTTGGGMTFSAAGTFTTTGVQEVTLIGQGYPQNSGVNFLTFTLNGVECSAIVNVSSGIASVSGCGTASFSAPVYAGTAYFQGDITAQISGIDYTGGTAYSVSTPTVNGIKLTSPLQGNFTPPSPTALDISITGTPVVPGNTVLPYTINAQACSLGVPVLSGTGRASGVTCGGALSGTYEPNTPMGAGNTKVITLSNVTTVGTFAVVTNTANGVYFSGSLVPPATGPQNMTLTAHGTPLAEGTFNYTVTLSSTDNSFVTCNFDVSFITPAIFPICEPLGAGYQYVKASNTQSNDQFGCAVKMSADGLTLAVGAYAEASNSPTDQANNSAGIAGAVYIYTRPNLASVFSFQAYIKPGLAYIGANDKFGYSLDLSNDGNTLVVGAPNEAGNGTGVNPAVNNNASLAGAAYVFTRTGSTWSQLAYLKANNTQDGDLFGMDVAVSGDGNVIAVGAYGEDGSTPGINGADNNSASYAGAVYVYSRSGNTVTFVARIKSHNIGAGDYFGYSVALDNTGETMVVGANYEDGSGTGVNPADNNSATSAGAAYIFVRSGSTWSQQAYLKANNTLGNQEFGYSVSISGDGNRVIVGAAYEDGTLAANTGSTNSGAAYIYNRSGATWSFAQRLKAGNFGANDNFGRAVAISNDGGTLAIGAPSEDSRFLATDCPNFTDNDLLTSVGGVYVFREAGGSFIQTDLLKMRSEATAAAGATAGDNFGYSVSLNANGKSVCTGTPEEDGSGLNVNPAINDGAGSAGCVMVFTAP